jgi:hypothetical protein
MAFAVIAVTIYGFVSDATKFRGADMCLDIFNDGPNNNQPHLVKCGARKRAASSRRHRAPRDSNELERLTPWLGWQDSNSEMSVF